MIIQMELDILRMKTQKKHWTYKQIAEHFDCSESHVQVVLAKSKMDGKVLELYNQLLAEVTRTTETKFKIQGHTLRATEWQLHVLEEREKVKLTQIGDIDTGYYYICELL